MQRTAWFIIATHTTRHLRPTLIAACAQRDARARVVVCCDNDRVDVRELVLAASGQFDHPIILTARPFAGTARLAQNRNNGVRAALLAGAQGRDQMIFLDGDCPPAPDFAAGHLALSERAGLVIGRRIDLSPEQTGRFDLDALCSGREPVEIRPEQHAALRRRQLRAAIQNRLKRLGLVKAHKPKPLGANHSVTLAALLAINGYDEEYVGYGQEDDDLGRRLYAAGQRSAIGITRLTCYHLYHEARQGGGFEDCPGARRFGQKTPTFARHGISNPLPQDEPAVRVFERGREAARHDAAPAVVRPSA